MSGATLVHRMPIFGVDYNVGWIGFTFTSNNPISIGIVVNEELDTPDLGPVVSHAFVVTGNDLAESAEASGVKSVAISGYLADRHCRMYFRRPTGWTPAMGQAIASAALSHDGEKYGYWLIVADFLADNPLGRVVNWIGFNAPHHLVSGMCDRARTEICSELAAKALQSQMRMGCLLMEAREITPLRLFRDRVVFCQTSGPFQLIQS